MGAKPGAFTQEDIEAFKYTYNRISMWFIFITAVLKRPRRCLQLAFFSPFFSPFKNGFKAFLMRAPLNEISRDLVISNAVNIVAVSM